MFWRRKFFRFLKEEGVFRLYIENIYKQHQIDDFEFWNFIWKVGLFDEYFHCSHAVDYAFNWERTSERHAYWANVHEKWLKICNYRS